MKFNKLAGWAVFVAALTASSTSFAQRGPLSRLAQPISNPGEWIKSSDYPEDALREAKEGQVGFMLRIDKDGRVVRCTVTMGSGTPSLDQETCRLITERALFKPAADARGRAVEASYVSRVNWVVPGKSAPLPLPAPGSLVISFTVMPDGKVENCTSEMRGLASRPPGDPCDAAKQQRFQPGSDGQGKPEARRVTIETSFKNEPVAAK